ncbi:MAG: hypothetical protein FWG47_01455 [Propionibacteriaceae bacterium]|nr:hypothetical protein [Propionibacteriaceae bacterium]
MAGEVPRFLIYEGSVAELSIFIDESGDFGADSDFYVVALVLHDQRDDISLALTRLTRELEISGLDTHWAIHTGAAIRGENVYRGIPVQERRREFTRLFAFARSVPALHQTFAFRKCEHPERLKLKGAISKQLWLFLKDNAEYFLAFERVIVYYDNGQAEITDILNTLFNAFFFEVDFRRVAPAQYRLFQVADLHCTLEILRLKLEENKLSRSDLYFFESKCSLRKDYLDKLNHKQFSNRKHKR